MHSLLTLTLHFNNKMINLLVWANFPVYLAMLGVLSIALLTRLLFTWEFLYLWVLLFCSSLAILYAVVTTWISLAQSTIHPPLHSPHKEKTQKWEPFDSLNKLFIKLSLSISIPSTNHLLTLIYTTIYTHARPIWKYLKTFIYKRDNKQIQINHNISFSTVFTKSTFS